METGLRMILPSLVAPSRGPADDGKRSEFTETAERFILFLREKKKERVWERKGLVIGPERSLADDGKRLPAMDVAFPSVQEEGVWGRRGGLLGRTGGCRITGGAFAMDVVVA